MKRKRSSLSAIAAILAPILMTPAPVHANDTSAVLGAGGLELTTSEDIVMASEDLYLSPSEVRVRYAFVNESDDDITTTVAFPLPDIDQNFFGEMVSLPAPDEDNFVDFRVTVDGKTVQPKLEQKAFTDDGADVSATLVELGLPLNAQREGWEEKVRELPGAAWQKLVAQGLLDVETDDRNDRSADFSPTWVLRATFHWQQTFPAGETVNVHHRYKPIVGGVSVFEDEQQLNDYQAYCLDAHGKAGLRRLMKQTRISPLEVSYVPTTGSNWKGPIRDFHLTIDKEQPHAILSLCERGLKKMGPTTFELSRTNFTPKDDIRFVVFKGE
ncbi:DUF4424 domain-containing protein [Mesorhizobium sp. WSM2240]|uniref:DUF4424 domain-containing protein n=3 Tax=unclassified Mesorhizobium TaxID=325217 RepID=A0AAU8DDG6_9HYPH